MSLELTNEYKDIAEKLQQKFPVNFDYLDFDKILFLVETEKVPKGKYAECRKVMAPYNFLTEYKFIITFYEGNMIGLTEAQKVMVVFHELFHIDTDFEKIRKHDIEDFREVIMKAGNNPFWDIDPNLGNILDDDDNTQPTPGTVAASSTIVDEDDSEDDTGEPEIL
jgi:predicted metallopeptidase